MSKRITVIGTGYVGLVSAVGLSDFGNNVVGVDINESIVSRLNAGEPTIYEHGITDYLERNRQARRLTFTTDASAGVRESSVVFLAVGTPEKEDGGADLSYIERAARTVGGNLREGAIVVTKSTVPVGTNRRIKSVLAESAGHDRFAVVSNPEFLREGRAVQDFFHPDRIVIGYETDSPHAGHVKETMEDIYRPLYLISTPFVWCSLETAELIKYASNAFLATKITFINQMANLAEACDADIHAIARTMGMDGRISPKFLHPGPGYGGSCFPKDTQALAQTGEEYGVDMSLIKEVIAANEAQKARVVDRLERLMGTLRDRKVAVLGVSFKAETDDVRESPAITIVRGLLSRGATVAVHDPKGLDNFRAHFGDTVSYHLLEFEAIDQADAILIATEWNAYRNLDLARARSIMRGSTILDTRNVLDPQVAREAGFTYAGVGR